MSSGQGSGSRPFVSGALLAVLVHVLVLMTLGWRIPKVVPPAVRDGFPSVEVQLFRRAPHPPPPGGAPTSRAARSRPSAARPSPDETAAPSAPVAAPSGPAVAEGPSDCAVEDLPLLTEAEKARCRNEIDADKARRLARGADERAAKQVAEAERGPQTYRMATEKQAYYDAVAAAYKSPGHVPFVTCVLPGMRIKRPHHGLKLGPCIVVPPQGKLTEEIHLDPLDPEWLPEPPKPTAPAPP